MGVFGAEGEADLDDEATDEVDEWVRLKVGSGGGEGRG